MAKIPHAHDDDPAPTVEEARAARVHDGKTTRNATVLIAVVLSGAAAYWLGGIMTPLMLAIFMLVMIDGMTGFLRRRLPMLPDWGPIVVAIGAGVLAFVLIAFIIAEYASGFRSQIDVYGPRLNDLIVRVAHMLGVEAPPSLSQLFTKINPARYLASLASGLQSFASNAVFVLVYLGFLIASRAGFARKVVKLFPDREDRTEAAAVFQRIRFGIERYLWIQTVTGLIIAAASWAVMAAVGLDNAFFWAFLIFVAGYIPIIGGAVGCIVPPVFALVQFDTLWQALVLLVALNLINFIVGNVILPRMQGDSLNVDPVVVLLSLAFWGALWGISGMFLSTPLTVMAMVVLAQFKGSHWIAVLLSANGDPLGIEKPRKKKPA